MYLYTCICTSLSRLLVRRYCRLFFVIVTSFYSFFVFQFVFVFYIRVLPEWRINILHYAPSCIVHMNEDRPTLSPTKT